jgi:hypothetical protein
MACAQGLTRVRPGPEGPGLHGKVRSSVQPAIWSPRPLGRGLIGSEKREDRTIAVRAELDQRTPRAPDSRCVMQTARVWRSSTVVTDGLAHAGPDGVGQRWIWWTTSSEERAQVVRRRATQSGAMSASPIICRGCEDFAGDVRRRRARPSRTRPPTSARNRNERRQMFDEADARIRPCCYWLRSSSWPFTVPWALP